MLEISKEFNNFYFRKFTPNELIFYSDDLSQQLDKFVEAFIDGKLKHEYISEQRQLQTRV